MHSASSFNTNNEYTIPAARINGEVRIEGLFTPSSGIKTITSGTKKKERFLYTIDGRPLSEEPDNGLYIADGKKFVKYVGTRYRIIETKHNRL